MEYFVCFFVLRLGDFWFLFRWVRVGFFLVCLFCFISNVEQVDLTLPIYPESWKWKKKIKILSLEETNCFKLSIFLCVEQIAEK